MIQIVHVTPKCLLFNSENCLLICLGMIGFFRLILYFDVITLFLQYIEVRLYPNFMFIFSDPKV